MIHLNINCKKHHKILALFILLHPLGFSTVWAQTTTDDRPFEFFTTIDQLRNGFAIVNVNEGKALYGRDAQNVAYDVYSTAFASSNAVTMFKVDGNQISGGYLLRAITPAGGDYSLWGSNPCYLNAQSGNGISFILGLNSQNGQDFRNGAVWGLNYVAGQGWTLQCVVTGKYCAPTNFMSDDPYYWQFCSVRNPSVVPQISTAETLYAYRIQNVDNTNYYFVANGSTLNSNLKTSNGADASQNTAYWYFVPNSNGGYSIMQLMSSYGVHYPDLNTGENVNSTNNETKRHQITLTNSPSSFRFNNDKYIVYPSKLEWEIEPNGGNGAELNWWSNTSNNNRGRWNYVNLQTIPLQKNLSDFTINGDAVINNTGNTTYTHSNSLYSEYFQFQFNTTTYYKVGTAAATTSAPSGSTDGVTYTWTLEGISSTYATINSNTGVINYAQYVTGEVNATVKLTATHGATTKTVSKQVTFKGSPTVLAFTSNALNMTSTTLSLPGVSLTAEGNPISGTITYSSNNTGCVSVNNTGVLTINGAGTAIITAAYAGDATYSPSSATMTITVANTDALDETVLSDMTITPSSQTLDLGGQVTYTASESLNNIHRTCQAYTTITTNGNNYYKVGDNYQAVKPTTTETPGEALRFVQIAWTFSGGNGNYYSPSEHTTQTTNNQVLTRTEQKTATTQTFTITATGTYGDWSGPVKTATATVTIPATWVDLTALHAGEALNLGVSESGTLEGHYTWEPNYDAAGASYKKFTYTSSNINVATVGADGNVTAVGAGSTTITLQSIKMDGTNGVSCDITVNVSVAAPTISIDASGYVTITPPIAGLQIRYTTNGSNPTATTGNEYSDPFGPVSNETVVKAVTVSNSTASSVASKQYITTGISGSKVVFNDLEDHNWSYYKGEETTVGNTTQTYNDKYRYTLYSPDPRNVKITYRGYNTGDNTIILNGTSSNINTLNTNTAPHVSPVSGEGQNTFVYYKTLEQFVIGYFTDNANWDGIPDNPNNTTEQYPYTVISNPFSVRPSTGSDGSKIYYGFGGWKIISGGEYILNHNDNDILSLDELIHFTGLDNGYTPNTISGEIVLEATWNTATVITGASTAQPFTGGTYETNFIVTNSNMGTINQNSPCTITAMNPDGTGNNSGTYRIDGLSIGTTKTTDPYDHSNTVKVEWIMHGGGAFEAQGRNMIIGRGVVSAKSDGGCQGTVRGNHEKNVDIVNTVKVESGYFEHVTNLGNEEALSTNTINSFMIFGCDYDRARANYYVPASEIESNAYNIKLRAKNLYACFDGSRGGPDLHRAAGQLYARSLIKSGIFSERYDQEYYFHAYGHKGQRYIEMEGGYNRGHIKGGSDGTEIGTASQWNHRSMSVRMKGGRIDGWIGLGSTQTRCSGDRLIAVTGGYIGGWIAPGSNCESDQGGVTEGKSFVYLGGTAQVNSHQFGITTPPMMKQSEGGVIYGSGLGYSSTSTTGEMTDGSNIVLADDAYCERGIYGGGALGQTKSAANIFILGGRVGTGEGEIKDQENSAQYTVKAGVYGGACYKDGVNAFIYMSGGVVESGIYGGCNYNGTMTGNTNVKIVGGQVGTSSLNANVHGGGYGSDTRVSGSVNVTIGNSGADDGATIYGDVYGGSAEGKTNGNTARTTDAVTTVTFNAGTINGNLYGGGLGTSSNAADVWGPVQVTMNGGEVNNVFGCNNVNGRPRGTVSVQMTGGEVHECVYGGGNAAAYTGDPEVTVEGGKVYQHVFGGGLGSGAIITGNTRVTIQGTAHIHGNVYGGGNGGKVTGNTHVDIK